MEHEFSRTERLIGAEGLNKLKDSSITIFGVGGVGSYTAEALARAGVGHLVLVDFDDISITNINRQLHSLHSTIGKPKVDVMRQRILDINPAAMVEGYKEFYKEADAEKFLKGKPDYVVDAIDVISGKVSLAKECLRRGIPFISSMGAGNRLTAENFIVSDISKTKGCPLAKAVRKALRNEGIITGVKVVFSPDSPQPLAEGQMERVPASISFVPSVAGLLMAGEVIRDLLN